MMLLEAQLEKQSDYQGATEELEQVHKLLTSVSLANSPQPSVWIAIVLYVLTPHIRQELVFYFVCLIIEII